VKTEAEADRLRDYAMTSASPTEAGRSLLLAAHLYQSALRQLIASGWYSSELTTLFQGAQSAGVFSQTGRRLISKAIRQWFELTKWRIRRTRNIRLGIRAVPWPVASLLLALAAFSGYLVHERQQGSAPENAISSPAATSLRVSRQAAPVDTPAPVRGERIIGNTNSRIYHWPGCPSYHRVRLSHRIYFRTRAEAEAAGFRAARNC
jgi:hypothetical protein